MATTVQRLFLQLSTIQPFAAKGAVNAAASLLSGELPDVSVAHGSLISIFGARLGPATDASPSAFPLSTTLAGVSIKATQGTRLFQSSWSRGKLMTTGNYYLRIFGFTPHRRVSPIGGTWE